MAGIALADASFLVALLSARDRHHRWAMSQAAEFVTPWLTCESAISEAFHLVESRGTAGLRSLLSRASVVVSFRFDQERDRVLSLMDRYSNVPMSVADACLVRMNETVGNSTVVTTDADFRLYRRHGRQVVACVFPPPETA